MNLIELKGIQFGYDTQQVAILDDLHLSVNHGECHCISGATGCGKSSLLHLIAGELSRPLDGEMIRHPALMVGLVMQDPNVQLLRQSVGAEIAFALENLGTPSAQMLEKVQQSLRRVGLYISIDTPVEMLSLGQKYRLMLAAQLVFEPNLLLLDEPWTQLDNHGVQELYFVLKNLLSDGVAIVMVEHKPQAFGKLVSHLWQLDRGKLLAGLYLPSVPHGHKLNIADTIEIGTAAEERVRIAPHRFQFARRDILFRCANTLTISGGEMVALVGDNGSGKSSLLKALAGIQADIGQLPLSVLGKRPKLGIYGANVCLLLQRPSRQLFEQTVLSEMQFSLRRFQLPLARAERMLTELGLTHLAAASPHKLSYGQQHIIALASLACLKPKVLLLDDPFAGLDSVHCEKVWQLLLQLRHQGSAILLTSHREVPLDDVDRVWHIEAGFLQDKSQSMVLVDAS
ncbi:energy-coupling factor ABC transporter ATP-binding protein [Shewanella abyssi]|uniref:ATP-binding cassette domain-containing protein n=1 Tax=Shewanella abyssi TaxID=311789 RepID=UPI00200BAD50|nr:ABC transporter ATP-binding protein [Shewanella abyssi]MCL1051295.1 energy-coupling factor ABC transporter ATP-binding protein [Shewanella abyssi]